MSTTEFNSSELEMLAVRCERDWDVFPGERAKIIAALRKFAAIQSTPAGEVTADAVDKIAQDATNEIWSVILHRHVGENAPYKTTGDKKCGVKKEILAALVAALPALTQQVERLEERIKQYRARLECDHYWVAGDDGEMRRVECEDDFASDGIQCRDATIRLAEEANAALTQQVERLTAELTAVSQSIGDSRYMDPPDGGDVSLSEQVLRMRTERDTLSAENARLAKDAERYEYVRKLNPRQFSALWADCCLSDVKFDDAVDAATAQAKQAEGGA